MSGGLLNAEEFPLVGAAWELEFLATVNSLNLNQTTATPIVSNSLKLEMVEVCG